MMKQLVKKTPLVRNIARWIMEKVAIRGQRDFRSGDYWEARYQKKGNSGPGSYNRLAYFKADTLNKFVATYDVKSVIEFGSGDGAQLWLARFPSYIGVDVSRTAITMTRVAFSQDQSKRFIHFDDLRPEDYADLSLSLDVIYHLIEDSVFDEYMNKLFDSAKRYVIVYSSNDSARKSASAHVKHRAFTEWVAQARPDFQLIEKLENPYPEDIRDLDNTSFADFFFFERVSQA